MYIFINLFLLATERQRSNDSSCKCAKAIGGKGLPFLPFSFSLPSSFFLPLSFPLANQTKEVFAPSILQRTLSHIR